MLCPYATGMYPHCSKPQFLSKLNFWTKIRLLEYLFLYYSITENHNFLFPSLLIVFFILVSTSTTVMKDMPEWFIYIFPYLLWPLGNISITSTVLMVVAVSTERYLAICRPLQYKPSPVFYILLVFLTSFGVNFGRFLEFNIEMVQLNENGSIPVFEPTALMSDER